MKQRVPHPMQAPDDQMQHMVANMPLKGSDSLPERFDTTSRWEAQREYQRRVVLSPNDALVIWGRKKLTDTRWEVVLRSDERDTSATVWTTG